LTEIRQINNLWLCAAFSSVVSLRQRRAIIKVSVAPTLGSQVNLRPFNFPLLQ